MTLGTADYTGTVNGGAGDDDITVNIAQTGSVNGGDNNDTVRLNAAVTGGVTGGAGTDTIVGNATSNAFVVTASGVGTVNATTAFTGVENLTGGAGNDNFAINSATAVGTFDGAGGSDTQTYAGAGAATAVTVSVANLLNMETVIGTGNAGDTLQGTTGVDAFVTTGADAGTVNTTLAYSSFENLAGLGQNDTFALSHTVSGTVDGGAGDDQITLNAGGSAASIIGDTGTDTIIATNVAGNNFVVTASGVGTVNGGNAFTGVENLTGGAGDDNFAINSVAAVGTFNGAGGSDTQTYAGAGAATAVTVSVANLLNMETVIGTGNAGDTLQGTTGVDAFVTTGADAGTVNTTLAYSSFENLAGLGQNDTFALSHTVSGTVDGGAGDDQITLNAGGSAASIIGDTGTDTIIATNVAGNNFVVTASGVGTVNGGNAFTGVENLTGGAGDDNFAINSVAAVGTFNGAGGSDTQTYAGAGAATAVTVSVANLLNMETVIGTGNAGDTLQGTTGVDAFVTTGADAGTVNTTLAYSSFENLAGLGQNDTFALSHTVSGTVDGGAGDDQITLNAGGSAASLIGGDDTDTIVGLAAGNAFVVNAANAGTVNGGIFNTVENLTGGAGTDTFAVTGTGQSGWHGGGCRRCEQPDGE